MYFQGFCPIQNRFRYRFQVSLCCSYNANVLGCFLWKYPQCGQTNRSVYYGFSKTCKMAYLNAPGCSVFLSGCDLRGQRGNDFFSFPPVAWLWRLSAACAVQVFIFRVGLAEIHESSVRLETRALWRKTLDMTKNKKHPQPQAQNRTSLFLNVKLLE